MRNSGQAHEGLMSLIPVSVLLFFIMVALGGPEAFARTVTDFATDAAAYLASWIRTF